MWHTDRLNVVATALLHWDSLGHLFVFAKKLKLVFYTLRIIPLADYSFQ
ncbi:MAG: hypothetical protein ACI95X_002369 [Paraglaciecola sp.]|jgi:hypothetical protein